MNKEDKQRLRKATKIIKQHEGPNREQRRWAKFGSRRSKGKLTQQHLDRNAVVFMMHNPKARV